MRRVKRRDLGPRGLGVSLDPAKEATGLVEASSVGANLHQRVRERAHRWVAHGAGGVINSVLREGVKVEFTGGKPPPPIRGREYPLAPDQEVWWRGDGQGNTGERARLIESGAWKALGPQSQRKGQDKYLSPCFLVPKKDGPDGSKNWRLVIDLRRINAHCKRYHFKMEGLRELQRWGVGGSWLISFDISDAFYTVGVREEDKKFFRFVVDGEVMEMQTLPMGWVSSPYWLTRVFKTLVNRLRGGPEALSKRRRERRPGRGYLRVLPYLDDFLCVCRSREEAVLAARWIRELLDDLGLPWHPSKCQWEPVQVLEHLGLVIDTERGLFLVSPKRVAKIQRAARDLLCRAAAGRRWLPAKAVAAFAGLGQSTSLAVTCARLHLRSLYDDLAKGVSQSSQGWGGNVKLSHQSVTDLEWWKNFDLESKYNGRAIYRSATSAVLHCDAAVDSRGRGGWGAVLNETVPARGLWKPPESGYHISHLELLAVLLAVETFREELRGKRVRLHEDNQAVVRLLETWSCRSPAMQEDLRRLWELLDSCCIELQPEYIRSEDNVYADFLSRYLDRSDWALLASLFQVYDRRWGGARGHTVDRFATGNNAQVPRFYSRWREPGSSGVDALAASFENWRGENNWCNPPWALLPQLIQLLRESGAQATVVAPMWPGAPWFPDLMEITSEYDVLDKGRALFRPGSLGSQVPLGCPGWDVLVCRVELRAPGAAAARGGSSA